MEWTDKVVLITGGTGSFGKKFIEVMLRDHHPKKLIVFSRDELKQHEMQKGGFDHPSLRYFIGDIRDVDRLRRSLRGVDVVVHAAALKQVPACEYNPIEAVLTNVMGARNIIEASLDCGVENVVALSTDKAVNPINLYGATKLVAEKLFIQANAYRGDRNTKFSCVRYGNVVGSRGSVIPLFISQKETGKLTVTDSRMTRFWITLEHGVGFVISCAFYLLIWLFLEIPAVGLFILTRAGAGPRAVGTAPAAPIAGPPPAWSAAGDGGTTEAQPNGDGTRAEDEPPGSKPG